MATTVADRKLLVAGEWLETGDWVEVRSPYSGEVVSRVAKAGADEEEAVADERAAPDGVRELVRTGRIGLRRPGSPTSRRSTAATRATGRPESPHSSRSAERCTSSASTRPN